jgi:NAD(P)-dependent dehydrogenase (short-subunit alcohol dehydrogenase family)
MHGKTVIITGSNTGIGKSTAIELARRGKSSIENEHVRRCVTSRFDSMLFLFCSILGAHVILACRDRSRSEQALKDICRLSGSHQVEIELVDLASLASVRQCAQRLRQRLTKLDVLINNAGK